MPARIVVVLNNPELADAAVSALTADGYDALAVHDSMAALDLLEQAKDIELLVTSADFSEGKPNGWALAKGSVQKVVGCDGHRYDRSGDVDLGAVNALGIAIDRDGHAQRGGWRRRHGDQPARWGQQHS